MTSPSPPTSVSGRSPPGPGLATLDSPDDEDPAIPEQVRQEIREGVRWASLRVEAEEGRTGEAMEAYRRAWLSARESTSPASMSSFRWGSTYLKKALEHTPAEVTTIRDNAETIVVDLLSGPDAFAGWNWAGLVSLGQSLEEWESAVPERAEVVQGIAARVHAACPDEVGAEDAAAAERCRSLLRDGTSEITATS